MIETILLNYTGLLSRAKPTAYMLKKIYPYLQPTPKTEGEQNYKNAMTMTGLLKILPLRRRR